MQLSDLIRNVSLYNERWLTRKPTDDRGVETKYLWCAQPQMGDHVTLLYSKAQEPLEAERL